MELHEWRPRESGSAVRRPKSTNADVPGTKMVPCQQTCAELDGRGSDEVLDSIDKVERNDWVEN